VQIQSLLGSILGHTSKIKTNVQKRRETSLSQTLDSPNIQKSHTVPLVPVYPFLIGEIEDDDDLEREDNLNDLDTSLVSEVSSMNQTVIELDPEEADRTVDE